jgi:sporulation protein YlmC with PRC-barrel domain
MKTLSVLTCATLIVGLAPVVAARLATPQSQPTTTTVQVKSLKLMRVGADLTGMTLVNRKNESLGKVEDIIVHPKGDIAFIEFSGAGSLKTGVSRYPVPWRALSRNEEGQFVLDSTSENFAKAPHYDKQANMSNIKWFSETDKHFAKLVAARSSPVEASVSLAPAKMLYLGSDLRSRSIENPDGEKVAMMHELVIDPDSGRIAYVVLSVGGSLGSGEKMIAVPWEALKAMPDKSNPKLERLTLSTTKDQLAQAPEFQPSTEGWKQANDINYIMKVYEFYTVPPYWVGEKKVDSPSIKQ